LRNESTLNVVGKVFPKDRTKTLIAIQKHKVHENYPKGEPIFLIIFYDVLVLSMD